MLFIANTNDKSALDAATEMTRDWENRAARGECGWICPDCCCSFPGGMPDKCEYGHQGCTDIIQRDKQNAKATS